ncbi:hypothetical protein IQ37_07380 [Chryseobacterium piperi]|uniref:General stress protein 17M-like domain-containing protein n=1 Tax=Chryseobacterium piperi TaxID=558152 RepID=A0A086BJM7_9FLAO|nr:hypothetical protein [Chryseobacterium piperi]ASW74032.1 hypothetical protein CJF12_06805 [Chryseobacterium piperi]KFF29141.1 hypothetical protein IQ37_07380 [Chryseobacterium piperi]
MSKILAGLFESHSDYKKLETDLESSGFENSDYIVYLNDHHNAQYLASVAVRDNDQTDNARNIFSQNSVLKTYLFENMSIEQADYHSLKKYIDARSRAEIHNSPNVKIKGSTNGMDSEVKF